MAFDPAVYGPTIERALALPPGVEALQPLVMEGPVTHRVRPVLDRMRVTDFPEHARSPRAALAGLWLHFGYFDQAHAMAQDLETPEGSLWHAILHRREPDAANATYWYRRIGRHLIYPQLLRTARSFGWKDGPGWDPLYFVEFCERARTEPGSNDYVMAGRIQQAEWQLLFHFCATPPGWPGV